MSALPKRRKFKPMQVQAPTRVDCQPHCRWVRGHCCVIEGRNGHVCSSKMEAHHVVSRGAGGGDEQVVSLCADAHADGHMRGWETWQKEYGVDLAKIAHAFWTQSPHRQRWEREWRDTWGNTAYPYEVGS